MKARPAIIAALPRELAPLVRGWEKRVARPEGIAIFERSDVIAVCGGMGADRALRALDAAADAGPLAEIISTGYAGALRSGIAPETIHWPSLVVDGGTGEAFLCEGAGPVLVTWDRIATPDAKPELAARWRADLVDMEAAAIARRAAQLGVRFRAVKIVTDQLEDSVPDFSQFIGARGEFRESLYAAHLALHPQEIPAAMRLGRRSARCSRLLAEELNRKIGVRT